MPMKTYQRASQNSSRPPRADAIDELADLEIEYPVASTVMSRHHLAALIGCSDAAVDVAEDASDELLYELLAPRADIEPLVPECGALNQWKCEVAAGYRNATHIDALSRAAITEANGRDELRLGLRRAANCSRLRAAAIVVESRRERTA